MEDIDGFSFKEGYLYLFSDVMDERDPEHCLWGVFNCSIEGQIELEVMTYDNRIFYRYKPLPDKYLYVRLARHDEIRDFTANRCYDEIKRYVDRQLLDLRNILGIFTP